MAKPSANFFMPSDPKALWSSFKISTLVKELGWSVLDINSHPRDVIRLSSKSRVTTVFDYSTNWQIPLTPSSSQKVFQSLIDLQWGYFTCLRASIIALTPAHPSSSQRWNYWNFSCRKSKILPQQLDFLLLSIRHISDKL